jgi:hypothetical protein
MKKFLVLVLAAALCVSCQKQQTEEEKRAEVERQVQERLAEERKLDEQKRLKQEEDAKALAAAATTTTVEPPATPTTTTEETTTETAETRAETPSSESYGVFYEKLEPHGSWRETSNYGYVWQPHEAEESRGWRPYTEGRWAYSDAGWTWISDEPFGWATYHYGRWVRLQRLGWVWVPGNEWAPAWVSWRTSKDYVGWAPLPPEARFDRRHGIHNWADNYYDIGPDQYAFVRGEEFGSQHVRRSLVPAEQNVTIVLETTIVTNIIFSNTTVINQGPNYDEIRARSREPMERYHLRRHSEWRDDPRSAMIRGDEIEIAAPELRNVAGFHRPRSIKERVSDVTIDNGWTNVRDRSAAERARTRIRTEATPPPNAPPRRFVKPTEAGGVSPARPTAAATAAPAIVATATPAPIATLAPTPRPIATAAPTARPSATVAPTARPSATVAPPARPSATVALSATPTPRMHQSPGHPPRATLTPAASPPPVSVAAPTNTPAVRPVVPAPTATPAIRPVIPRPTATPAIRPVVPAPPVSATIPPSTPTRPRPSISPAAEPSAAVQPNKPPRKPEDVRSPRPLPRQSVPPVTTSPNTAVEQTPPVVPVKPRPTLAPPVQRPTPLPRLTPPATAPSNGVVPPSVAPVAPPPKRMPPRVAPPAVTPPSADIAPAIPPKVPPANDQKPKDKRAKPPGPLDGEIVTPPPSPTPAPR